MDDDTDDRDDVLCDHESMTRTEDPAVWSCDLCGALILEVDDPNGPVIVWDVGTPVKTERTVRYEVVQAGSRP